MFIADPVPDLDFLPIPDPGVKKAPDPGSATLHTNMTHDHNTTTKIKDDLTFTVSVQIY